MRRVCRWGPRWGFPAGRGSRRTREGMGVDGRESGVCERARVADVGGLGRWAGRRAVGVPDLGLDVRRRAGGRCALPAGSRRGRWPGCRRRRRLLLLLLLLPLPHAVPPRTRPLSRGLPARASRGSGAGRRSPSPRPPPAVQVPSAFRRGGLKTPGGSPVRPWVVGGGPVGEFCGEGPGSSLGSSADSAPPSPAGVPAARASPSRSRRPSCRRACAARAVGPPPSGVGGGNPRAPVGCPCPPPRWGRRARRPRGETFRPLSESGLVCRLRWPA